MFRDPAYFLALREQVVPLLHTYPSLKVWVAGCSTGEEVYSLAILLHEEGLLERTLIYATDINPASLDKARQGIFPLERDAALHAPTTRRRAASAQLSDYYTGAYDGALFDRVAVRQRHLRRPQPGHRQRVLRDPPGVAAATC